MNLVVAEELLGVSPDEVLRVLCPNGVAYFKQNGEWTKVVKPWPQDIDDWTHYFHDSTGNPVAHDRVVDTPERLQWVGSPRWSRHHDRMASMSALVSAKGRMTYIMDEGSRISIQLPSKWKLVSRRLQRDDPVETVDREMAQSNVAAQKRADAVGPAVGCGRRARLRHDGH